MKKDCEHLYPDASDNDYCVDCGVKLYYRVKGENGVYVFTRSELENGLDRANFGTGGGEILPENKY